jgi:hypothetical protein
VPVVRRPDYTISLEQDSGRTFLHCEVRRWTAPVARAFRADVDAVMGLHGGPIYAASLNPHGGDHAKWRRFVTRHGFRFHASVTFGAVRHSIYVRNR